MPDLDTRERITEVLNEIDSYGADLDGFFVAQGVSPAGVATVALHHARRIEAMTIEDQLGAAVAIGVSIGLLCRSGRNA